jgi:uncharacterized protein YijF (DUF1287 family)
MQPITRPDDLMKNTPHVLIVLLIVLFAAGSALGNANLRIVEAARAQVGKTLYYDPSYHRLAYPQGDVPEDRGVCTDVVIRALRRALAMDLQQLVHEDMRSHFDSYPRRWGLTQPDPNIDHRRVPNLRTYFNRQGWGLEISPNRTAFLPGDIVTCMVPPGRPHIMIISDKHSRDGQPLIIHNIGIGTCEEDRLFDFQLTGHYRIAAKIED